MKDFIQKHWINALGITFLFTAFLYFLKIALDHGWLPPELRAAAGLVLGVSGLFTGFTLFKKGKAVVAETIAGLGVGVIYATLAYVSFSDAIAWSHNALLISMIAVSITTCFLAVRYDMRMLYLLSTIGGLITPMILQANEDQDMMLFIYLLIINIGALYISHVKGWIELKVIAFVSSVVIYSIYYVLFDPIAWGKPFFYVSSLFVVYIIGTTLNTWNKEKTDVVLDHYLGVLNAINFVFWSTFIFGAFDIPHTFPMILVGLIFLGIGLANYLLKHRSLSIANAPYLGIGLVVMALACSDTGYLLNNGLNYVVNAGIWLILLTCIFLFGKSIKSDKLVYGAYLGFAILTGYWYSVAWLVEWVEVFGIPYIPFFNAGAMIWVGLIFMGFYFSSYEMDKEEIKEKKSNILPTLLAVFSHVIIGGLLTIQISNLWDAYDISWNYEQLVMSVVWIIYAMIIYIWSNISHNKVFKWFGSIVLGLTSLKVFIFDLHGSATFDKMIFLAISGVLVLVIARINAKYRRVIDTNHVKVKE